MKRVFKYIGASALAGISIIGLAACSTGQQPTKEETSTETSGSTDSGNTPAQTTTKDYGTLNVSFPTGNIRISFDILALKLGYFKEEGVTVNPVNIIGNNALTAIEAESPDLDLLTAGFVADVQHIGNGASLTFVGGTAVEGGAIITKKGNKSKYQDATNKINLEAVANAKYGLVRNQAAWIVTRSYLKKNYASFTEDIDKEDGGKINFYDAEDKVALAVQQGAIDLGYTPLEYALLYQDSYQLDLVAATGDLEPEYVCCREVTSKAKYEAKYDAFVAYEKARIRAWEYYANEANKTNVVKIVSEYSGKESSYVETYLYGGVTKFSTDPNKKGIIAYAQYAYDAGVIKTKVDLANNVSTGAYEKAITDLATANPSNTFYQEKLALYNTYNK